MFYRTVVASLILSATTAAHASTPASLICDGDFSASFGPATTIACSNNLSITGGELNSAVSIWVEATGDILLDGVSMTSPDLQFRTGGRFVGTAGTSLSGNNVTIISTGNIVYDGALAEASLTINPSISDIITTGEELYTSTDISGPPGGSIPEPSTYAMMALGLLGIAATTRRRR